jgi:hypothetical protein
MRGRGVDAAPLCFAFAHNGRGKMRHRVPLRSAIAFGPLALTLGITSGCAPDTAPSGLRATPDGDGPEIVFDLVRKPLPELPLPNDVATFPDPTSRTGRRVNVSLVAPTRMEEKAREGFAEMEGWGTFAPITVAFARSIGGDPRLPAIDLASVRARMQGDGYDFGNDPVYVINLTTGLPVPLDMGNGNFPQSIRDLDVYFPNDPKVHEQNILFETVEEGAGLTQDDYAPALDLDFDGVLDHPNTLGRARPGGVEGVDNLLTWYERETDTLIMKPLLPMEEKTEYAVVVTDRLAGPDGKPVRSPFPFVHHPQQRDAVARVRDVLADPARRTYFGDLAGTGLDHVAFAWAFTTQPVYEDMRLLRDGLYGKGPFARFEAAFPPQATAIRAIGLARASDEEPASTATDPRCTDRIGRPFIVKVDAGTKATLHEILNRLFHLEGEAQRALEDSLDAIDHFVIGTYASPYLLGDPDHEDPDAWFHVNFKTGEGRVATDRVPFWLAVPKANGASKQPFPTTVWAHGTTVHDGEVIVRAGYFAKQGIATFALDMPGHGLILDPGTRIVSEVFLRQTCMVEWINGLTAGRARELNGDGVGDSGGLLWTSHIFHSRDNIRQSVLDELQAVRLLRSFDGTARATQDYDGDGAIDLSGDFDADGIPDIGGGASVFTSGNSYGGLLAQIHGAVDPFVTASAPISGGGGLMDVATRSALVPTSVVEQTMTPLLVTVPAAEREKTLCRGDDRSLRFVVNDLTDSREIEIACLKKAETDGGRTIVVTNLRNKEQRCARATNDGRLRVPIPANAGDRIDVQLYDIADAVVSYGTCAVRDDAFAHAGRHVATWEQPAVALAPVAEGVPTCDGVLGCQQFRDTFFPVGSPLVAPQEGLGLQRQTPDFRRLYSLSQAAVDPADPINFAPYYMLRPIPGLDGANIGPRPILNAPTVGDGFVPTGTGNAFARAAGVLPFFPPSAVTAFPEYADYATPQALYDAWHATPNEVLVDNYVIEGVSRLKRTHAGATCDPNFLASPTPACGASPAKNAATCAATLFDPDYHSQGADRYAAPHPDTPLRLARIASIRATDADALARSWAPRIRVLADDAPDYDGWNAATVAHVNAYINPTGQHVWITSDPCKAFDDAAYYDTLLVRFLATGGRDVYFLTHPRTHRCMATEACPIGP